MKLRHTIPLEKLGQSVESLRHEYSQFTFVVSQGYLKVYEQVQF